MPEHVEQTVVRKLHTVREEVPYFGVWLLRCFSDVIVMNADYVDETRPRWLVTGLGSGRYGLDRWYRGAGVVFEFQGQQHFTTGSDFVTTQEELIKQQRDGLKRSILERRNITVVAVHTED